MSKIISFVIGLGMLALILSGGLAKLFEFFSWLFLLQNTQADISISGQIFVRIATLLLSYGLVGFIFNLIGFFNSKLMKIMYFFLSTLIAFGLSYLIMLMETYMQEIMICLGILLFIIVLVIVVFLIKTTRENKNE